MTHRTMHIYNLTQKLDCQILSTLLLHHIGEQIGPPPYEQTPVVYNEAVRGQPQGNY